MYDIFLDLINGMRFLHENDLVHRDLHDDNVLHVMVDGNRRYKIADFIAHDKKSGREPSAGRNSGVSMDLKAAENGQLLEADLFSLGIVLARVLLLYPRSASPF